MKENNKELEQEMERRLQEQNEQREFMEEVASDEDIVCYRFEEGFYKNHIVNIKGIVFGVVQKNKEDEISYYFVDKESGTHDLIDVLMDEKKCLIEEYKGVLKFWVDNALVRDGEF